MIKISAIQGFSNCFSLLLLLYYCGCFSRDSTASRINFVNGFATRTVSINKNNRKLALRERNPFPFTPRSSSTTILNAAASRRRKNSGGAGGKSKKKNSNSIKSKNNRSQQETKSSSSSSPSKSQTVTQPPWKVLSSKEIKKNVEVEKQRRLQIKQGKIKPSDTTTTNSSNTQRRLKLSKDLLNTEDQKLVNWKRFNSNTIPVGIEFIGAYLNKQLPPRLGVPEVAFLGRSNVGKSSLLNALVSSSSSSGGGSSSSSKKSSTTKARVGKTPGATASVNMYLMKGRRGQSKTKDADRPILGMVDLPGFGYAKLSKEVQESIQDTAELYLNKRKELALGILLVDIRRSEVTVDDKAILAALYDLNVPLVVIATKIDKISSSAKLEQNRELIRQGLGLPEGQPLSISSTTNTGIKELWKIILDACEMRITEIKDDMLKSGNSEDDNEEEDEEEEEDDDDIAYDQGYDWIHDTAGVTYETVDDTYYDKDYDDDDYSNDESLPRKKWNISSGNNDNNNQQQEASLDIRALKKKARHMERKGEI